MTKPLKRKATSDADLADLRRRERAKLRLHTPDNGNDGDIDYDLLERMIDEALASPHSGNDN